MRKAWLWGGGAAVMLVVAWLLAMTTEPPPRAETVAVDRGPISAKVTATGTLSALVTVEIGAQVTGRIQQLNVDYNSPVRKGQVLARIDAQLFQAAVEQTRANYVAAQGNLTKSKVQADAAERQMKRLQSLSDKNLIAYADLDAAIASYEAARAQAEASAGAVEQARAALNQAQVNLNYTTISSPIDGVVISRNVDVGQTVAASLQAPTLFVLAEDLRKMQVNTSVAEADIGKLSPGMKATFTVDAYPKENFEGTVRQIRNAPQTIQNVVTYDAVIDVENPELRLKPGMTVNVTFVHAERQEVVRVPNSALRFKPTAEVQRQLIGDGGGEGGEKGKGKGKGKSKALAPRAPELEPNQRTLWVQREPRSAEPVVVTIGITDGIHTEIVEGDLHEGDAVITDASALESGGGSQQKKTNNSNPFRPSAGQARKGPP